MWAGADIVESRASGTCCMHIHDDLFMHLLPVPSHHAKAQVHMHHHFIEFGYILVASFPGLQSPNTVEGLGKTPM